MKFIEENFLKGEWYELSSEGGHILFDRKETKTQNAELLQRRHSNHSTKLCQGPVLYEGLYKKPRIKDDHEGLGNNMVIPTKLYLAEQYAQRI